MGNQESKGPELPEDHVPSFPHDKDPKAVFQDEDPRYPFQVEMDRSRDDSLLPDYDWLVGEPGSMREELFSRTLNWVATDDDYNEWWKNRYGSLEEFMEGWERNKERIPLDQQDTYARYGDVQSIYERIYNTRDKEVMDGRLFILLTSQVLIYILLKYLMIGNLLRMKTFSKKQSQFPSIYTYINRSLKKDSIINLQREYGNK